MTEKILFVYEGQKTEKKLSIILKHYINLNKDVVIETSFCGNLYSLYTSLNNSKEEFDEDIIPILKSRYDNPNLDKYDRNSFGSIYLFFDYDSHAHDFNFEKLSKLLSFFNNETENGKLFISYPMIEALKHIANLDNKDSFLNDTYLCKDGKKYKGHVNCYSDVRVKNCFSNRKTTDTNIENYNIIIDFHCCKANYIINENKEFPEQLILQKDILNFQYNNSNNNEGKIYTLSSYPLMLLDYFGCETLATKLKIVKLNKTVSSSPLHNQDKSGL